MAEDEKPGRRIRLFESYGRRDSADFAQRLREDLEARGYEVWQDVAQIRSGDDWALAIRDALASCDAVIAILSPHAVRQMSSPHSPDGIDSVCLDEISYARFAQPPKPIIPIMAVPCEPPLVIFRLDFVDFSTWQEKPETYGQALDRLLEGVEGALRGEIRYRAWDGQLAPWDFGAFLNEKRARFSGRDWLLADIESWRQAAAGERALLVTGDPGVGKSALVAELVHRNPHGQVLAYHCCQADTPATLDPARFVRSLAAMIASRLPGYAAMLERGPAREALAASLCEEDPASAFEAGILTPLASLAVPRGEARYILVDALDEALLGGRRGLSIVDLLAPRLERLPPWLRLVATTRREEAVLERLQGLRAKPLEAHDARNLADLDAYIGRGLAAPAVSRRLNEAGLSPAAAQALLRERAGGNFLYARQALQGFERGLLDLTGESLPPAVGGLYRRFLARSFPAADAYAPARQVLEVLLAAREPLSDVQLAAITGMDLKEQLLPCLKLLSGYAPAVDGRHALFHKSLAEWLRDAKASGPYHVDAAAGRRRLLAWARQWHAHDDSYALAHLPAHLAESGAVDELEQLLLGPDFRPAKAKRLGGSGLDDLVLLVGELYRAGRDDALLRLAQSGEAQHRDALVLSLGEVGEPDRVESLARRLMGGVSKRGSPSPEALAQRQLAIRLASARGIGAVLESAADDPTSAIRAMLVPHLYRFWRDHRVGGWALLDRLGAGVIGKMGLPDGGALEVFGGLSLAVLANHFDEPPVMARLQAVWQTVVHQMLGSRLFRMVGRRWVIASLTQVFKLTMKRQPDYQPVNFAELVHAFEQPPESRAAAKPMLEALANPTGGHQRVVEVLLERDRPYNVYLMLLAERCLVLHGAGDPGGVLASLLRIHRDGCRWFRQSGLYVGFHVLKGVRAAEPAWLADYATMVEETISDGRALFRTEKGSYALVPHMAAAEMVWERHRPAEPARFIPRFFAEATKLADHGYATRIIRAAAMLSSIYRRHQRALQCLREMLAVSGPELRGPLIAAFADIRFYAEGQVDLFLAEQKDEDFARAVKAVTPTVNAADFPSWIDAFFNHMLVEDAGFRAEVVEAFRRAEGARSPTDLFQQIVAWMLELIAAGKLVAGAPGPTGREPAVAGL